MRLTSYLIGIPAAVLAGVVAIANRESVTFSLDPFSFGNPDAALSVRLPLFVLLLAALMLGVLLGWSVSALSHWRRRTPPLPPQRPGTTPTP